MGTFWLRHKMNALLQHRKMKNFLILFIIKGRYWICLCTYLLKNSRASFKSLAQFDSETSLEMKITSAYGIRSSKPWLDFSISIEILIGFFCKVIRLELDYDPFIFHNHYCMSWIILYMYEPFILKGEEKYHPTKDSDEFQKMNVIPLVKKPYVNRVPLTRNNIP